MRILFLRQKGINMVGAPETYYEFEQTVSKYSECRWAGKDWPQHKENEILDATVKRVMPDADWVINKEVCDPIQKDGSYKVGHFTSDLHGKYLCDIHTPQGLVENMNQSNYDILFLKYKYIYGMPCPPDIFLTQMKTPSIFLPWSMNPEKYYPQKEKTVDVTFLGNHGGVYPLRNSLWVALPAFCRKNGLKLLRRTAPSGGGFKRYVPRLMEEGHIVGEKYCQALRSTRILVFGGSRFRYPVQKYFEGMASGCLVMADTPGAAEELHFRDGYNFVDISIKNWKEKLLYYSKHRDEAEQIAEHGRETILKYHTHEIRAKQFLEMLRG